MHEDRVLVVDDDDLVRRFTGELLLKSGYRCACAANVEAAHELLHRDTFDLLISDIKMPGNCNLEFIKSLRNAGHEIPVILMTGFPEVGSAIESIQLGVVAYLVKPFSADHLIELTRTALQNLRIRNLINDQRERLRGWMNNLTEIERVTGGGGEKLSMSVDSFLELTFSSMVGLASDMKRLTEAALQRDVSAEACHLLNCPRGDYLYNALVETIEVLEKTKGSFKSKELGSLRKKLEMIVKNRDQNGTAGPASQISDAGTAAPGAHPGA